LISPFFRGAPGRGEEKSKSKQERACPIGNAIGEFAASLAIAL